MRTVFAMAVAALLFAAVSGTSQAAPIAPLSGTSADASQSTKVYWHHGWHRGWHRHYERDAGFGN